MKLTRKLILEGVNEREITLLTRYFVKESIDVIKNNKESISITVEKDQDIFPDKLRKFLNKITFKIGNLPKKHQIYLYHQVPIGFNDAYFDEEELSVVVELLLNPRLFNLKMTNELVSQIKNFLSHEIQHAYQRHFKRDFYDADAYDSEKINDSFESLKSYWLLPTEVEANAKGIYKEAKHLRISFTEALDRFINWYIRHYTEFSNFGEEYQKSIVDLFDYHFRSAVIDYARKNFPASQVQEVKNIIRTIVKEELEKLQIYKKYEYGLDAIDDENKKSYNNIIGHT